MAGANVFSVPKCPRCQTLLQAGKTALSRRDLQTTICSDCGAHEMLEETGYVKPYTGPRYWERCDRTIDWIGGAP